MLKVSGDILSHIKVTAKSPLIFIPLGLVNAFKKNKQPNKQLYLSCHRPSSYLC